MNTIEGLKKLVIILNDLFDKRDSIHSQIDGCYKPFKDIIKKVFIHNKEYGSGFYIDDVSFDEDEVSFAIRWNNDDEIESTHCYPIESFVSAETLTKYLCNEQEKKAKAEIKKKQYNEYMAKKYLEEAERETYEKLKKKFEGA